MIKPHILIRTYQGDKEWLRYCLASIRRHCPDIGLTVVAPTGHDMGCECTYVEPVNGEGYVDQQYTKLRANLYVPKDTSHVVHIDSDCIMLDNLDSLFVNGKPVILKTSYDLLENCPSLIWRSIVFRYTQINPEFEYMRRLPLVYPIEMYEALDKFLTSIHGPWHNWFHLITGRRFSEFNIMGTFADKFMNDKFYWLDTSKEPLPKLVVRQGWSWGGLDAVRREWDELLGETA